MTISTGFHDYQRNPPRAGQHSRCSPALTALAVALGQRWHMSSLGCYGVRDIRGGELPSTHAYGAALDISYATLGRTRAVEEVIPYLVGWSGEWGVQAIHDYFGCRIWRAGRTPDVNQACDAWWKAQRPDSNGMGSRWATYFHIEVHPNAWSDARDESSRLPAEA